MPTAYVNPVTTTSARTTRSQSSSPAGQREPPGRHSSPPKHWRVLRRTAGSPKSGRSAFDTCGAFRHPGRHHTTVAFTTSGWLALWMSSGNGAAVRGAARAVTDATSRGGVCVERQPVTGRVRSVRAAAADPSQIAHRQGQVMSFTYARPAAGLVLLAALAAGCGTAVTAHNAAPKPAAPAHSHAAASTPAASAPAARAHHRHRHHPRPMHVAVSTPPAPPAPSTAAPTPPPNPIPQGDGGDQDADNNGGPSDGDGNI